VIASATVELPLDKSVVGESWHAVYTSTSGVSGDSRPVSGTFFTPHGAPPDGGWPTVSLAHGTTGIESNCAPSSDSGLSGYLANIEAFLRAGYAVAFSDYEGLGTPGAHPYLEPRTAAFNIIDAVRALRALSPAVSPNWVAVGVSQGGQAAWAADELNSFYGDRLHLVGSVAVAPAVNLSALADMAWNKTLSRDQQTYYPLLVVGLARYDTRVREKALLHGRVEANLAAMTSCESPVRPAESRWQVAVDLKPRSLSAASSLRDALRGIALPQRPLSEPLLVINGMQDDLVLPQWVSEAVTECCRLGGRIDHIELPDAGHTDLTADLDHVILDWIADRFDLVAAPSNCPGVA
jgi:hypothetical protein